MANSSTSSTQLDGAEWNRGGFKFSSAMVWTNDAIQFLKKGAVGKLHSHDIEVTFIAMVNVIESESIKHKWNVREFAKQNWAKRKMKAIIQLSYLIFPS